MNKNEKLSRARSMLRAEAVRRTFCRDQDVFCPLQYIEFELDQRSDVTIRQRDEIWEDGVELEACVCFYNSGKVSLEMSKRAIREALNGLPSARFALAHEIAHVFEHRRKMKTMVDGAKRNFTADASRLHRDTQAMENEAHIFGGLLLIPLSQLHKDSDFMELSRRFNAPPQRAKQLRWDVMEVWSALTELRTKRQG